MPYMPAAYSEQMAAHPLAWWRAMYSAEPAVSSASTAFISGWRERKARHCERATGWECTSVMVSQSSSGRQQMACSMCSLCSPTTVVPLSRSNS